MTVYTLSILHYLLFFQLRWIYLNTLFLKLAFDLRIYPILKWLLRIGGCRKRNYNNECESAGVDHAITTMNVSG